MKQVLLETSTTTPEHCDIKGVYLVLEPNGSKGLVINHDEQDFQIRFLPRVCRVSILGKTWE